MVNHTSAAETAALVFKDEDAQLSSPIRLSDRSRKAILLALKFVTAKGNWPHPNAPSRFRSVPTKKKRKNKPANTRRKRLQHFAPHPRTLDPSFPKADPAEMGVLEALRDKLQSHTSGRTRLSLTWLEISGLLFGLSAAKQLARAGRIAMSVPAVLAAASNAVRRELENSRRCAKRAFVEQYGMQQYTEEERRWKNHLRWIHAYILWANCNQLSAASAIYRRRMRGAAASVKLVRAELARRGVELPADSKLRVLVKKARRLLGLPTPVYLDDYSRGPRRGPNGKVEISEIPSPEQLASLLTDKVVAIIGRECKQHGTHAEGLLDDHGDPTGQFKDALELVKSAPSLDERRRRERDLLHDYKISKRFLADQLGVSEGKIRHDIKVAKAQEKAALKAKARPKSEWQPWERADLIRKVMPPETDYDDDEDPYIVDIEKRSDQLLRAGKTPETAPVLPTDVAVKAAVTELNEETVNKYGCDLLAWLKAQLREYPGVVSTALRRLAKEEFWFRRKSIVMSLEEAIKHHEPHGPKPAHWDWLAIWLVDWMKKVVEAVSPDVDTARQISLAVRRAYGM